MSKVNAAVQKNSAEQPAKISNESVGGKVIFTSEEWAYLEKEINKQIDEGHHVIDYQKAINNARYLAKLVKSIQQIKDGKVVRFTDEEWEKIVNEQELLV